MASEKTKDFIVKSESIHGIYYDYFLVNYISAKTKVKIICPKHGIFEQTPTNHLSKKGCKKCGREKCSAQIKSNNEQFIKKARLVHGADTFDYSLVDYISAKTKIKITCPLHGVFKQTPHNHLHGFGCLKCGGKNKSSAKDFASKAEVIHNGKYDYSLVVYVNDCTKVKITCPLHGVFKQVPSSHLQNRGCPRCTHRFSKGHQKLFEMLKQKHPNEQILLEEKIKTSNDKHYFADILLLEKNIIIEYYGDYWHCNPKKYKLNYYHSRKKMYAKDIWKYDDNRKQELEKLGYKVYIIWESDFKTNNNFNEIML